MFNNITLEKMEIFVLLDSTNISVMGSFDSEIEAMEALGIDQSMWRMVSGNKWEIELGEDKFEITRTVLNETQ